MEMHWGRISSMRREADLDRELRSDLELEAEEQGKSGLPTEQVRDAARRALGNLTKVREETRAVWTPQWLEDLMADLRFAIRTFGRKPEVTALIVLILALGTGANTAILSVANVVLIEPLPYRDAGQLMTVWNTAATRVRRGTSFAAGLCGLACA